MDILVEFTGATGETKRLQIDSAPKGTELVVLEQFLAGPSHLSRMISEASEGQQEPEKDDSFLRGFTININEGGESSLFAIRETIENVKDDAARHAGRIENSPLHIGGRSQIRAEEQATRANERIRRTKQARAVQSLHAAAADCLKVLEETIREKKQGK